MSITEAIVIIVAIIYTGFVIYILRKCGEKMEKAKRYKGICPTCGKVMWICKSVFMEMGG